MVLSSSSSAHEEESRKVSPQTLAEAADDHHRDWMKQKLNVPMGYRFNPTDVELVLNYLFNKLLDLPLPADIIPELDFSITDLELHPRDFGNNISLRSTEQLEPRRLLNQLSEGIADKLVYWKENEAYFFACKDERESSGFWKAVVRDEGIAYDGNVVGLKSMFAYYHGGMEEETDWVMTEYRVHPNISMPETRNKKLKLYKIQYSPKEKVRGGSK